MIELTLTEIAAAAGGELRLAGGASVAQRIGGSCHTDSREIKPGDIFFARRGESSDGHLYAEQAAAAGAAAIICERQLDAQVPQIIVADTTAALGQLARAVVATLKTAGRMRVIAVTGSNGKTTTKNLLAKMLERVGQTVAAEKSFNNDVGAPLTMLRAGKETDFLVLEMGASGPGEITRLTSFAQPDYGVVLMVGLAHSGGFGGIEATALAKREMVEALGDDGVAVLNAADPRVHQMAAHTRAKTVFFGDGSDYSASDIEVSAAGTSFTLKTPQGQKQVRFPVLGAHHVSNALAAATVASLCGVSLDDITEVLESTVRAAKWRMEVTRLPGNVTLINDAYNASPDSMAAALKTLAQVADPAGRSIAVLGEMSELGDRFGSAHDEIGILAVRLRISQLVVVGKSVRRMYISAINEGAWSDAEAKYFETHEAALEFLRNEVRPHDTVLVKSSNAAKLRLLGDRLKEELA